MNFSLLVFLKTKYRTWLCLRFWGYELRRNHVYVWSILTEKVSWDAIIQIERESLITCSNHLHQMHMASSFVIVAMVTPLCGNEVDDKVTPCDIKTNLYEVMMFITTGTVPLSPIKFKYGIHSQRAECVQYIR